MTTALWLLATQGVIGAFDTLYYHEWRARLPALVPETAIELRLHAVRDFFYAALFAILPWISLHGFWVLAVAAILISEILLTLTDFVVEIKARAPLGDVFAGERVTHAVMGIVYGSMIAFLAPTLFEWWQLPTAIAWADLDAPNALRWVLLVMAAGVFGSGLRDLYASFGLPGGCWPWTNACVPNQR